MTATRARVATALLLALAAGTVDAVGYIVLHQTFPANMTGNTTKLGITVGRGDADAHIPIALAVTAFIGAIGVATATIELAARRGLRSTWTLALAIATVVAAAAVDVQRPVHELRSDG